MPHLIPFYELPALQLLEYRRDIRASCIQEAKLVSITEQVSCDSLLPADLGWSGWDVLNAAPPDGGRIGASGPVPPNTIVCIFGVGLTYPSHTATTFELCRGLVGEVRLLVADLTPLMAPRLGRIKEELTLEDWARAIKGERPPNAAAWVPVGYFSEPVVYQPRDSISVYVTWKPSAHYPCLFLHGFTATPKERR